MDSDLARRARSTYERSRFRRAIPWASVGLGLAAATHVLTGDWRVWGIGLVLGALLVGFVWRGMDWGRSVGPGLIAGALAWAVPMVWACRLGACGAVCTVNCAGIATLGGLAGGALLWRAGRGQALGALAIASCCGAMGCLPLGLGGVAGLAVLSAVGLPAAVLRPSLRGTA